MAYKPGRKEGGVAVSDAASRVLGPEDPGAREEVEARRDREFSTMEQIGLAADMLPGGAIAVRTGEELAKVALRAFDSGGISKAIEAAAVSSKGNNTLLSGALKFIDDLIVRLGMPEGSKKVSTESLERLGQVRDAVKSVVDRTLDATASMRNQITRDDLAAEIQPLDPSKPIFDLGGVKGIGEGFKSGVIKRGEGSGSPQDVIDTFRRVINEGISDSSAMELAPKTYNISTLERALAAIDKKIAAIKDVPAVFNSPEMRGLRRTQKIISDVLKKGVETSKKTADIMATKDLPPATRMSKDMPPLSGRSRIDKEGLEGLATSVEGFSSMTDDEIMYWLNYNRGRPPGDADAARRAKEAMSLLMQEAKKRGLL